MADYKSYRLTGIYQVLPAPTKLLAPYDLNAAYDKSAGGDTQSVNVIGLTSLVVGNVNVSYTQHIIGNGFDSSLYGIAKGYNTRQQVRAGGFSNNTFGVAVLKNKNQSISLSSFVASQYGHPTVYNLRQYVSCTGLYSAVFGTAYMQGGVKYVTCQGYAATIIGQAKLINTRADQYVDLNPYSRGIAPPFVPIPNVSPRILYPSGILPGPFGATWVQRNPSPKGFTTDSYGTNWVSHSPRYITPFKVEAFLSGYAKIFDPMQRIHHEGSPHIPGGIFGDIGIKNTRRVISVGGEDQSKYGDWAEIYSNLSNIGVHSFDSNVFGTATVWNKTPSVIPKSWGSASFGTTFISDRVRRILGRGIEMAESQRFGIHTLSKPPEIKPGSFSSQAFGNTWISNKIRHITPPGLNVLQFNIPVVWFRYRYVSATGINFPGIAAPKIEHGLRNLVVNGSSFNVFGTPIVWFKVRSIQVPSIYREFETHHLVGGTQRIRPSGFVDTRFGERIVPENQSIYGLGFSSQGFSETHQIELHTRWVRATGFLTFGTQTSDRYGTARAWNKRQYVQHKYDSGDGLNPGDFGKWTAIANRNRNINAIGFTATKYGYAQIDNNARLLLPTPFVGNSFGTAMIADRIRRLRLEGMEPPYMSGWGRVFNTAHQMFLSGSKHDRYGQPTVINTRREYRWVGAFESMSFGQPMVAFRIRRLSIESRYSIAPIYLPIPKVELHTRYIDPQGPDLQAFGGPSLHIKWNTFTPRWTHRNYFGEPTVRNLTPEIRQKGNVTEEIGKPSLRLQWRFLPVEGYGSELWGKTNIAFRDRSMTISGNNYMAFGLHRVVKTGAPPYSLQTISLDWAGEGERPDDYDGLGIRVPQNQVPYPSLKTNVIFASGFVATKFGSHHAQSNGIIIDAGIQEFAIGNHNVGLRNRTITVPTLGDLLQIRDTRPRVSPHTIYAVMEAPGQAVENHNAYNLHFVNSDEGRRAPGEVFGQTTVTLRHRKISAYSIDNSYVNEPTVSLRKRYIKVAGFNSFRMGWHYALDGSPQDIEQYDSENMQAFGLPTVNSPYHGPQTIRFGGIGTPGFGSQRVEHFHRTVQAIGSSMLEMGSSRGGDTAYKPQSLWVGRPMPTIPVGFNSQLFGVTTIGLRVRELNVIGFDSFISNYDYTKFNERMRVIKKELPKPQQLINALGFAGTGYGVPNIANKVHYIRPDGNAEQYRKGAF